MVEILIGCNYCVRDLNEKIFSGLSSATNEHANFKITCDCIRELLFLRIQRCMHTIDL